MENQESATHKVSLRDVQSKLRNRNRRATNLGKFVRSILGCFRTSEMTQEDWEKLESKKQIAHYDQDRSIKRTRVH